MECCYFHMITYVTKFPRLGPWGKPKSTILQRRIFTDVEFIQIIMHDAGALMCSVEGYYVILCEKK